MADRQGIEIDYCPQCRGVWLDRGELDKLIERSAASGAGFSGTERSEDREPYRDDPEEHPYREGDYHGGRYRRKRRGFLGELFDFD
jgi:Zn-finger nucleic acid-binding protein